MFIEITLPNGGRVFIREDSIQSVTVGKLLKDQDPVVTTTDGTSYNITVDAQKNAIARLIGMRS